MAFNTSLYYNFLIVRHRLRIYYARKNSVLHQQLTNIETNDSQLQERISYHDEMYSLHVQQYLLISFNEMRQTVNRTHYNKQTIVYILEEPCFNIGFTEAVVEDQTGHIGCVTFKGFDLIPGIENLLVQGRRIVIKNPAFNGERIIVSACENVTCGSFVDPPCCRTCRRQTLGLYSCEGCFNTFYCSVRCQVKDYFRHGHCLVCGGSILYWK